jgi:hypothetical protein
MLGRLTTFFNAHDNSGIVARSSEYGLPARMMVSTVLLKTDRSWDGANYGLSTGAARTNNIEVRHSAAHHPALAHAPNAERRLRDIRNVDRGERGRRHHTTIRAGDVLPEMMRTVHRGRTGNTPVELIVFYVGAKGMPTAVKAP